MKQSEAFLRGEGDAMLARTGGGPERDPDPVLEAIRKLGLQPYSVLEIGCGDGWRLKALRQLYAAKTYGIDPSIEAVLKARKTAHHVWEGTAGNTGLGERDKDLVDMVIYGFCLYLVDREDLFKVVAEGDRVLKDGGHLIILDFYAEYPHAVSYKHKHGLYSYHMDYSKLWLAHPGYRLLLGNAGYDNFTGSAVHVLKKDFTNAFPVEK